MKLYLGIEPSFIPLSAVGVNGLFLKNLMKFETGVRGLAVFKHGKWLIKEELVLFVLILR